MRLGRSLNRSTLNTPREVLTSSLFYDLIIPTVESLPFYFLSFFSVRQCPRTVVFQHYLFWNNCRVEGEVEMVLEKSPQRVEAVKRTKLYLLSNIFGFFRRYYCLDHMRSARNHDDICDSILYVGQWDLGKLMLRFHFIQMCVLRHTYVSSLFWFILQWRWLHEKLRQKSRADLQIEG